MSEIFIKNENRSFFHAWIADSRRIDDPPNISKQVSLRKNKYIVLFTSDQEDETRTNMVLPGCFPNNATLLVNKFTICSRFTNMNLFANFLRGAHATLFIGDRPIAILPANIMADPESLRTLQAENGKPDGLEGKLILRKPIAIPPRQGFYFKIDFPHIVSEQLSHIERGKVGEYGEIRIDIHGIYSSYVKRENLSPEELEEALAGVEEHKTRLLENNYSSRDLTWCLTHEERLDFLRKNTTDYN